jgi:hypothetical protein
VASGRLIQCGTRHKIGNCQTALRKINPRVVRCRHKIYLLVFWRTVLILLETESEIAVPCINCFLQRRSELAVMSFAQSFASIMSGTLSVLVSVGDSWFLTSNLASELIITVARRSRIYQPFKFIEHASTGFYCWNFLWKIH